MKCDALIIGGGVIGTSIAYNLAKRNTDVILVEKNDIASGTSGACDGFVFMQSKKLGIHLEMALESARLFGQLSRELQRDIEYDKSGGMILIESKDDMPEMEKLVKRQQKSGLDVDLLDIDQARKLEPNLSNDLAGATYSSMDAHVNPIFLSLAYAESAKKMGAKILADTEIMEIKVSNGKIKEIKCNRGQIKAEIVINASGVYSPMIASMVGIDIPIMPRRGQIVVIEPMPKMLNHVIICNRYIKSKYNADEGQNPFGVGLAIEQTHAGSILIGSTREFVGYNRNVTPEGIKAILSYAERFIPAISDLHIIRTFAGLRPYTKQGLPVLGKVRGIEGFIMASGHEGDGIALSPITGKLIAEFITTGKPDLWADCPINSLN